MTLPPVKSCFFSPSFTLTWWWSEPSTVHQGYKLEDNPFENYELDWFWVIVESIRETAYNLNVCWMWSGAWWLPELGARPWWIDDDGYDKSKMMEIGYKLPESFVLQALQILSPVVWLSSDQDHEEQEGWRIVKVTVPGESCMIL